MNATTITHHDATLTIGRIIDAPKDKVWEAYTSEEVFVKWFSPDGWTTHVKHFDLTPGGYLLYGMRCEDKSQGEWFGKESWGKSEYKTVTPKDSLSYKDYFSDENGNPIEGMPVADARITFEKVEGKTKITSVNTYESSEALQQTLAMGMEEGVKQTFDKLAKVLE